MIKCKLKKDIKTKSEEKEKENKDDKDEKDEKENTDKKKHNAYSIKKLFDSFNKFYPIQEMN